jgi:hypothetical protein
MKNLKAKPFALLIFLVFVICFAFVAFKSGKKPGDFLEALKIAYKTIPLVLLVVGVFIKWAWRWPVFRGWLVPFPDLNGTWQGSLQTTWVNPQTQAVPGPIPVILCIKQSFISTSCVMRTQEMDSHSYSSDFVLDPSSQIKRLAYSYTSSPRPTVVHRSPPHDGTVVLDIIGKRPDKLRGKYWTERKTTGEIELTFRCKDCLEEFPTDLGQHPVTGDEITRRLEH